MVMDCALSPVQQRNLEKAFGCKVIDRTGLILEIFGRRARTAEGALQVELAHLAYQKSRLVRSWTHLERQRGGFGFLGGPGETQIETDRRLISERMVKIERDLESVKRTRALHRASRADVPYPIVALVGYTNAGKSTLFNRLTRADVMAADMLFATLDPTMRLIKLPHGGSAILSDTVGFISDLPTMLISAFRATLEEVRAADVIVHVRDISHADSEAQSQDVETILDELGVADRADRVIEVWNKLDRLDADARAALDQEQDMRPSPPLAVSALTGEGIDRLHGGDRGAPGARPLADRTHPRSGRRPGPALALRARRGDEPRRRRRRPAPDRPRRARPGRPGEAAVCGGSCGGGATAELTAGPLDARTGAILDSVSNLSKDLQRLFRASHVPDPMQRPLSGGDAPSTQARTCGRGRVRRSASESPSGCGADPKPKGRRQRIHANSLQGRTPCRFQRFQ